MKKAIQSGVFAAAVLIGGSAMAAELETEAQKLGYVFGMEISWIMMLTAAPALVLFTIAAPGLPVGIGTALWTATLFASMLGLEEPMKSNFVVTWLALSGGLPDMFRTATNCTGDGFTVMYEPRVAHAAAELRKHTDHGLTQH